MICYDDVVDNGYDISCKHVMHESCIRKLYYMYMSNKCPMCRRVFKYAYNPSKKQKRRLTKKMISHYFNDDKRMNVDTFISLYVHISEGNAFMPQWLTNVMKLLFIICKVEHITLILLSTLSFSYDNSAGKMSLYRYNKSRGKNEVPYISMSIQELSRDGFDYMYI